MNKNPMATPGSSVAKTTADSLATRARDALCAVLMAALVYYSLFVLPFWFPPKQRLWSASYAFGFNNAVAILSMAGLLGIAALAYRWRRRLSPLQIEFPSERSASGQRSLVIAVAIMGLLYAVVTFAMYLYSLRAEPWLMWETRHFLHRARLMELYGLQPYTEFQSEYGPLLTSTPVYVHWLLKPLGASLEQAYFACHLLLNLAGLWCVYYILSRVKIPPWARVLAFVLLAVAGFAPYMGLNGVLLRYLSPFACLLLGHRLFAQTLSSQRKAGWLRASVIVLLLLTANILLSPEAAIAFALAWLAYGVLMCRRDPGILVASLIAFVAAALLCWLLLPAAYYGSVLRFSEGANNLPLLPAAHLLLYVLTMFLVVPSLLAAGMGKFPADQVPASAICGALGILCVVMAPGALGRCDPPHVLFFGMGASMLLMIRLANLSRYAVTAYAIAYAGVFIGLMQVVNLQVFFGMAPRALLSRHAFSRVIAHLRSASGTERPGLAELSTLDHYPRLGLPFATFGDPAVERYVCSRGRLDPEYYVSVVGVYTAAALERKLRDVGNAEYLLVPESIASRSPQEPCADYRKSLRQWFLYRARLPCRANPLDPGAAVNRFIADHYINVEHVGSWLVLRRAGGSSPIPSDRDRNAL